MTANTIRAATTIAQALAVLMASKNIILGAAAKRAAVCFDRDAATIEMPFTRHTKVLITFRPGAGNCDTIYNQR